MNSLSNIAAKPLLSWRGLFSMTLEGSPGHFDIDRVNPSRFAERRMETMPDFKQIVDDHYQALYRFALSMCRRQATAEDLVQQTFLQWARKGGTLRDVTKIKSWLFTTLYREWLSIARREKRFEVVEFNPDVHESLEAGDEMDAGPVDHSMVTAALEELDTTFRVPLVLFYMKELSYKEIAEMIGVPIGTVMSRLSRGKDMLRKALRRVMENEYPQGNVIAGNFQTKEVA